MTIHDKIRDEKLQYDINRAAVKISTRTSSKINKYECLAGEEILPQQQHAIIKEAKFTYSPLGKALEKKSTTVEKRNEKQIQALKSLESPYLRKNA